jgi:ATP-dependent RNA helicase DeaD
MTFENLPPLLDEALVGHGYTALTPVQNAVLEAEAVGRDLIVSAQTGSGKTVAFGLAMAPEILDGGLISLAKTPAALIVAPTRELALQVSRELVWLYAKAGVRIATCVGGMDASKERRALSNGAQIVVGTPGRLRDHLERGALDLSALKVAVLDEADEMLDMGFREELEEILNASPDDRRTLMFSATMPKQIVALAKRYQHNALRISTVGEDRGHGDISYQVVTVSPPDIENAVVNLLRLHEAETAILFCATRDNVRHLHASLTERGFNAVALSGEHSQQERNHALQALRDRRARVCVATDVAARGIDLPSVTLVVHVEMPRDAEALQHRSGRTGRAGKKGTAVLIVPYQRRKRVESMLRGAKIEAQWINAPTAADIIAKDHERLLETLMRPVEVEDEDRALGAKLLETMTPEDIAAALVQVHRAKMPVAAEMLDDGNRERAKETHRDGFDDSVWYRLNIGRNNNADPKWILPLLCRRGGVTKNDIGAIRITANETHVGIAQAAAARFSKAIQTPGGDEDHDVEITLGEGPPRDAARANKRTARDGGGREERGRDDRSRSGPRRDGPSRESSGRDRPNREAPSRDHASSDRSTLAPRYGMPRSDGPSFGDKPKGKPGGKPSFGTRSNGPRGDSVRPFGGGAPSKHGVKHKGKGNRPR